MRGTTLVTLMLLAFSSIAALPETAQQPKFTPASKRDQQQTQTIVVPAPQVNVTVPPVPQPVAVKVESEPERSTDRSLVHANWALVFLNLVLAGAAVFFGYLQRRDVERAMQLAQGSANASRLSAESAHETAQILLNQRREMLVQKRTSWSTELWLVRRK